MFSYGGRGNLPVIRDFHTFCSIIVSSVLSKRGPYLLIFGLNMSSNFDNSLLFWSRVTKASATRLKPYCQPASVFHSQNILMVI